MVHNTNLFLIKTFLITKFDCTFKVYLKNPNRNWGNLISLFSRVAYDFLYSRLSKVIEAIAEAIRNAPGVTLLDVDPGESTNRTVRAHHMFSRISNIRIQYTKLTDDI